MKHEKMTTTAGVLTPLAMALLVLGVACAARAEDEEVKNAESPYMMEAVTVTAQKQEENVQEVPISITVFNDQQMEDSGIKSINQVADFVPNLSITDNAMSGMYAPNMRGINAEVTNLTTTVAMTVDGVPITSPAGFNDAMLDIERIEMLRGPMGTLYGKNAEIGAINIISKQPDNDFRGKITLEGGALLDKEAGDGWKGDFAFNVSGPLVQDSLYFGLAGQFYHRDGFMENTYTGKAHDDRERWFGKAQLRWTPTEDWDISLIASRLKYNDDGFTISTPNLIFPTMFGMTVPNPGYGERRIASEGEINNSSNDLQSLKINYTINDAMSVTSTSARSVFRHKTLTDFDGSTPEVMAPVMADIFNAMMGMPIPLESVTSRANHRYEKLSQEFRFNYDRDRLKIVAGLYLDDEDNVTILDYTSLADMGFGKTDISSMLGFSDSKRKKTGNAYAAYFNITYPLFEQLNVVGGVRFEKQKYELKDVLSGSSMDDSWNSVTPRFSLEYLPAKNVMVFLTAAQGYRSGGFNDFAFADDPSQRKFDEEKLWNYELGVKSAFLDNKLVVNGSIFYLDVDDMQVTQLLARNGFQSITTNAGAAGGFGAELEVMGRVTETLTLLGSFGYVDLKFDDYKDDMGDYKNHYTPNAPRYTFSVGAQYRDPSGFYARTDLIGYGKMYLDHTNAHERAAFEMLNAKIGYETEHFDCYIYGNNIFNANYDAHGAMQGYYTLFSEPGEVGLRLVYRF